MSLQISCNRKYIFQELLEKDNSVSFHYRNIRILAVELYKVYADT